jgi:hypothetical protein
VLLCLKFVGWFAMLKSLAEGDPRSLASRLKSRLRNAHFCPRRLNGWRARRAHPSHDGLLGPLRKLHPLLGDAQSRLLVNGLHEAPCNFGRHI